MPPSHGEVAAKLDAIEAELRRAGLWQEAPLPDEAYDFSRAFASDTMTYAQWLQFVFVPRVRELVAAHGDFPASSSALRKPRGCVFSLVTSASSSRSGRVCFCCSTCARTDATISSSLVDIQQLL